MKIKITIFIEFCNILFPNQNKCLKKTQIYKENRKIKPRYQLAHFI